MAHQLRSHHLVPCLIASQMSTLAMRTKLFLAFDDEAFDTSTMRASASDEPVLVTRYLRANLCVGGKPLVVCLVAHCHHEHFHTVASNRLHLKLHTRIPCSSVVDGAHIPLRFSVPAAENYPQILQVQRCIAYAKDVPDRLDYRRPARDSLRASHQCVLAPRLRDFVLS